ncbi:MAG: EscU/YscU/HrcU family type III secretion system export apparatus switch protein [Chloroflexi bacterium]|nr:EscU/YscU/HrcU family type III secretion system export apparatus switch protein [Chloroflexota bacterium]
MTDQPGGERPKRRQPLKTAVALEYQSGKHRAPVIAAKGQGLVAERIIALAQEHGVPIRQDPDLVQVLAKLDLDQVIPPELYAVVAEVFAFVYAMNNRRRPA